MIRINAIVGLAAFVSFIMLIFYGMSAYYSHYPPLWFFMATGASFCTACVCLALAAAQE